MTTTRLNSWGRLLILAVALTTCLTGARAQSVTATLSGVVIDEMEAVIPGAGVTLSDDTTGLHRRALTDGEGHFAFTLLRPATYTVRVERAGFAPLEIRNAVLNVNDHLAYQIQLKVAGVSSYVVVEASASTSDGSVSASQGSASVGTLFDRRFVESLPLNGRDFQPLLELVPGAVLTRTSFAEQGQFSVNGQRANANYFTVDGVSANFGVSSGAAPGQAAAGSLPALTAFGGTANLVSVEALQEFSVQTSSYAPEFGRLPGAQITILTRSGTNEFHGTAFEYFRHDSLDSADWFASSRGLQKPYLRQSDFGGSLGGPLLRDRAFFFFSYEALRLKQPQVVIAEVPSKDLRDGAPASLRPFLNAFPRQNGDQFTPDLGEFAASYSDPSRLDALGLRLDFNPSDRLSLFGRLNVAPSENVQRGRGIVFGTNELSPSVLGKTSVRTETLTAGATWFKSARVSDDLRFNWSRASGGTAFILDDFGGAAPFGAERFAPSGAADDSELLFQILGGVSTNLAIGKNADNEQRQFNVVNNLSVSAGAHQLKLGVDYRRLAPVYDPARYFQRVGFLFARRIREPSEVKQGIASQATVTADEGARFPLFLNLSVFAQDTWRAATRLTLTYGVRWELSPPPIENRGNHPLHATSFEDAARLTFAPRGAPLWETTYGNFAPRLGASYQLSKERGTTLRAGAGLFYDAGGGQAAQVFGSVSPYTSVKRLTHVSYPLDSSLALPAPLGESGAFDTVYAIDPELKLPYSLQWNITLEQELGARQNLSVAYVGAAGRRLLRQSVVAATATTGEVRVITNSSSSDYRAMQAHFTRRLSGGLQAHAAYTWSHSIDDASEDSGVTALASGAGTELGASSFDVRHSAAGALTYDLRGAPRSRVFGALLRNWSVNTIVRARSATPVNVTFRRTLLSGDIVGLTLPSLVAGQPLYVEDAAVAGGRRINRAAFGEPGEGPTLGRNALRGFPMWQADVGLRRRIHLSERVGLQLTAEVFNVLNHPNFGNPVGDLDSGLFGQSIQMLGAGLGSGGVNGGLSPVYQVGGPRSLQLALKLSF